MVSSVNKKIKIDLQLKFSIGIIGSFLLLLLACTDSPHQNPDTETKKTDTLLYLNHHDSAKYVGIQTCRLCHQEIYNSFIKTGMGKSIGMASHSKSAADFSNAKIYDSYADFHYHAYWKKDSLYIHEYRMQKKDTTFQRTEKVDFIIGSGQHTNSHLQWVNGYVNQMPMTYFTQKQKWDLPPGFENGNNTRFSRKIGLECMSCHNALPDFVLGSENKYKQIPEGINCERCHGPGSIHVAYRSSGSKVDTSRFVDYSIVNPAKLPIDLQFDICQRCHLQGNAVLKKNKSFYDFKPGMKLSEVFSVFLPKYSNADDEFIMASHADRLKQSACFIKSISHNSQKNVLKPYKEGLTCVTCHNPHVSVKQTNINKFNSTCLNCHNENGKSKLNCSKPGIEMKISNNLEKNNCVSCHMPKSGSIDIPHVTVHDHYIRKPINNKDKEAIKSFLGLFAINESNPDSFARAKAYLNYFEKFEWKKHFLDSAKKYLNADNLSGKKNNFDLLVQYYFLKEETNQIIALCNSIGIEEILKNYLNKKSYENLNGWTAYRIGESFIKANDLKSAIRFLQKAVELSPFVPDFMNKLAVAYAQSGNSKEAEHYFSTCISENPKLTTALNNYGFFLLNAGRMQESKKLFDRALSFDPDNPELLMNVAAWHNINGNSASAIKYLEDILVKYPNHVQARYVLSQLKKDRKL